MTDLLAFLLGAATLMAAILLVLGIGRLVSDPLEDGFDYFFNGLGVIVFGGGALVLAITASYALGHALMNYFTAR